MKRKLIEFNAFRRIREESLSNAQTELEAAAPLLAEVLGVDGLALESFGHDEVMFESSEGDFVHAKYGIQNGYVQFDDVEQLVINEESEVKASREILSSMIDALVESDQGKADVLFGEWMELPRTKGLFSEERKLRSVPIRKKVGGKMKTVGYRKAKWNTTPKTHETSGKTARRMRGKKINQRRLPAGLKKFLANKRDQVNRSLGKHMKEWNVIAENVLGFVNMQVNGPDIDQVRVLRREGDVASVRVPTTALRNEARILKFDWKTMNTDLVVKRREAKRIHESGEFAKAASELRKFNAFSDNKSLENAMENAASRFPGVVYLTESELAGRIKSALQANGDSNFDDEACRFIAEGLLRTAHESFIDRVTKIVRLAGGRLNEQAADPYAEFRRIADEFYGKLDESAELEMQAFVDVYDSLRTVHQLAREEGNADVTNETARHLDALLPIVTGRADQDIEVLEGAAEWLYDVVEATEPEEWKTSEPFVTSTGEHPELAKKGRFSQSPADMEGSTPGAHYTSDGKDYRGQAASELEGDGWSNLGGAGVYPEIDNPYIPKADHPKIVGEKDVESDSGQLAHWGSEETWPNLQNPYSKGSVTPKSVKE
jgi:hypothetical protein